MGRGLAAFSSGSAFSVEAVRADVVIKFWMNLLRDPDAVMARYGVLSYHHGDPRSFRIAISLEVYGGN
jgi:hypothetical protein